MQGVGKRKNWGEKTIHGCIWVFKHSTKNSVNEPTGRKVHGKVIVSEHWILFLEDNFWICIVARFFDYWYSLYMMSWESWLSILLMAAEKSLKMWTLKGKYPTRNRKDEESINFKILWLLHAGWQYWTWDHQFCNRSLILRATIIQSKNRNILSLALSGS